MSISFNLHRPQSEKGMESIRDPEIDNEHFLDIEVILQCIDTCFAMIRKKFSSRKKGKEYLYYHDKEIWKMRSNMTVEFDVL